ncbi:MAG TPA: protoporphyrinogen oxidase [Vicinamibacterales bacterium]|jgi:oxygen-dependent protoporphyrinogen oxidase
MTPRRVVVAGGGITGLVTAFTLQQEAAARGVSIDLTVLDAGATPGGHAQTIDEDGWRVERGPNGFLDRGTETLALVDELQIRSQIVEANAASRRRFLLRDGTLRQVPESPPALMTSDAIGWKGKLRLFREPWSAPPPAGKDETIFEFAERRLGREAAETFVDTAVAGISGGDSRKLSVRSQFPILKEWEGQYGSLLKAMLARQKTAGPRARLLSFDGGLGALTTTLACRLKDSVRPQSTIERIEKTGEGWRIDVAGKPSVDADAIVLALPSHVSARAIGAFDPDLSSSLASIPYADMSVVALGYRAAALRRPLDGYGYLVTRAEDLSTLGVLWESSIFPHRAPTDMVLLRVMLGGSRRPEVSAFDDQAVADVAISEATKVLGISARPLRQWVIRHRLAIAQYTVGHDQRIAAIRQRVAAHQGLHICGTAYDGVSFNDAIVTARRTARAMVQELAA